MANLLPSSNSSTNNKSENGVKEYRRVRDIPSIPILEEINKITE
jgi:hypothetical protein